MKYNNIPADYPIKADLCTDPRLQLRSKVPCDLSQEAIEYAALRFLARSAGLFRFYANESCELRFAGSRAARRAKRFSCTAPAVLLELPGAWVRLTVRVSSEAITVTAIELLAEYPKAVCRSRIRTLRA